MRPWAPHDLQNSASEPCRTTVQMRSPLDCIEGSFRSAVFTTYSLNLRFFEHWVMPLLHASGIRNVIVFADETELGEALTDHGLRAIGRSYHVVSLSMGPGAFHP